MFAHRPRLAHMHPEEQHPLLRQMAIVIPIAALLAIVVLLLLPPHAHGSFV